MIDAVSNLLQAVAWRGLDEQAKRKLLLCLLANLSVAVAGRSALRMPRPPPGDGHLLLDGGQTGDAPEAAFYNAALMHARTQDDFHPIGNLHIATIVLPALLAQAERKACSGEAFLDALAVGYAASAGFSKRFSPLTTPRGLRSTSLYATLGAAAAVSRLRAHDAAALANTLALATQSAFGTTQCWRDGSDEYQLHAGQGAAQALRCADWTDAGVVGGRGALDGPSGFYPALTGHTPTFDTIAGDFDASAAIVETVLKRYPVSGICQPVVRLAERLASELDGRRVTGVLLQMNGFEMNYPGTLNAGPTFNSFSDRLMSARLCVASVLEAGRFDFASFQGPLSPSVSHLVGCTRIEAAPDLGTLSCRMTISLEDGASLDGELRDGGRELAIDWTSIGPWAGALWAEAGRSAAGAQQVVAAVTALPGGAFADLRHCLAC